MLFTKIHHTKNHWPFSFVCLRWCYALVNSLNIVGAPLDVKSCLRVLDLSFLAHHRHHNISILCSGGDGFLCCSSDGYFIKHIHKHVCVHITSGLISCWPILLMVDDDNGDDALHSNNFFMNFMNRLSTLLCKQIFRLRSKLCMLLLLVFLWLKWGYLANLGSRVYNCY